MPRGLMMFARPSVRHLEVTERKRVQRRVKIRRRIVVQVLGVKGLGRQVHRTYVARVGRLEVLLL